MSPTSATAARIVRSRLPDVEIPDTSVSDYTFRTAPGDTERVADRGASMGASSWASPSLNPSNAHFDVTYGDWTIAATARRPT